MTADIENGPWPLLDNAGQPQQFAGVVVTNYLWHQNDGYAPHFHIYLTGQRPSGAPAPCSNS